MKKILFIIGLIGAAYFAYYSVSNHSIEIQNDIKTRLAQSFATENVSGNIQAEVSGRDVTLTGNVSEEQSKKQAGQLATKLVGVRAVDNQIQVAAAPEDSSFESGDVSFDDGHVSFDAAGAVPVAEIPQAPSVELSIEESAPSVGESEVDVTIAEPEVVVEIPVIEAPVAETSAVNVDDIKLDGPLPIVNKRIVRKGVDDITAHKTVEAACEGSLTSLLEDNKIYFDSGKATIKNKSHNLLDRVVVAAKNCDKDTIITVNGYTDNEGSLEANRKLSLQRARAVGRYMLERGVAKQVKVVGNGPNDPVASNDTEEGRAQNRRIEFKVFRAANP